MITTDSHPKSKGQDETTKRYSITEISIGGLPKPEDLDSDGYCWWGWAANHTAANPMFWQSTWIYAKPPGKVVEKATHWTPAWAFPVIK